LGSKNVLLVRDNEFGGTDTALNVVELLPNPNVRSIVMTEIELKRLPSQMLTRQLPIVESAKKKSVA